jgi:hypothetical protein
MTARFDAAAAVGGLTDDEKAEIDLLVEFQRCLQDEGPYDVIVPFAAKIRAAFSKTPRAVRIRRDIGTLIAGVAASAVMHKAQRDTDEQGRIVATLDDYGHAIDAFGPGVGIFHNPRQSPGVIALVRVLEKLIEKEKERCVDPELFDGAATAPRRLLAKELGLSSQKTVAARLEAARDGDAIGCLNDDAGAGVARRYRVLISSAEMDKAREGDGANSVFPSRAFRQKLVIGLAIRTALQGSNGRGAEAGIWLARLSAELKSEQDLTVGTQDELAVYLNAGEDTIAASAVDAWRDSLSLAKAIENAAALQNYLLLLELPGGGSFSKPAWAPDSMQLDHSTWRLDRIRDAAMLSAEARRLENCAKTYAAECAKGETVLYVISRPATGRDRPGDIHDDGAGPVVTMAMAQVRQRPGGGARLVQLKGPKNADPAGSIRQAIVRTMPGW